MFLVAFWPACFSNYFLLWATRRDVGIFKDVFSPCNTFKVHDWFHHPTFSGGSHHIRKCAFFTHYCLNKKRPSTLQYMVVRYVSAYRTVQVTHSTYGSTIGYRWLSDPCYHRLWEVWNLEQLGANAQTVFKLAHYSSSLSKILFVERTFSARRTWHVWQYRERHQRPGRLWDMSDYSMLAVKIWKTF